MNDTHSWNPTHRVPEGGLTTRSIADPTAEDAQLAAGLEVELADFDRSGWDRVVCSNGFSCWVETGHVAPITIAHLAPPPDLGGAPNGQDSTSGSVGSKRVVIGVWAAAVVAVIVAIAVVASGDDGDSTDETTSEALGGTAESAGDGNGGLTRADFLLQANAICADANGELEAIQADVLADATPNPDLQQTAETLAEILDQWEPVLARQDEDLRALNGPEPDRSQLHRLLDDLDEDFEEFQRTANSAADGDQEALQRLATQSDTVFDALNDRARALDLSSCAE